jgi:heterodisulfide reductase subunit C2
MDALRKIATANKAQVAETDISLFNRIFLASVKQFGRVFEVGMLGIYNVLSGHYLKDVLIAPRLLAKGKLRLLPPMGGHAKGLKDIFAKVKAVEAKAE